jgi:hypothetical protein
VTEVGVVACSVIVTVVGVAVRVGLVGPVVGVRGY